MGEIARETSIPIATGERLVSPHEFQNLFAEGACAFAQPDLGSAGGITACKKIATLAEVNYVLMAPHIWGGPIITAAAIQICANVPNFLIQESIYKSAGFFDEIIQEPFVWEAAISCSPIDRALAAIWTKKAWLATVSEGRISLWTFGRWCFSRTDQRAVYE